MKKKIIIFSSIFIFLDQVIKLIVRSTIMGKDIYVIPKFFYVTGIKNTGGAFSILSNNTILLALIGLIILAGLIYYLKDKELNKIEIIAYSLLIGGIIGNFIDRVVFNGVYDYLGFIFGSYYFPVFNLADIGIVISVLILIVLEIKGDKDENRSR